MERAVRRIFACIMAGLLIFTAVSCAFAESEAEPVVVDDFVMGTMGRVIIYGDRAHEAAEKVFDRVREIEQLMSVNIEESDVYRINENAGMKPVRVHSHTMYVIDRGLEFSRLSEGSFDITIFPLVKLWSIGTGRGGSIPSPQEIENIINHIDYNRVKLYENNQIFLEDETMGLDLGGIAKGYAVDEGIKVLEDLGIESASVNLGGDIRTLGKKPDGTPWRIGIQHPFSETRGKIMAVIEVVDKSVVTSGIYERFIEFEGRRYHHVFDPSTGYPVDNGIVSVTVVSGMSIDGDALSTAILVSGPETGLELVNSMDGTEVMIIMEGYEVLLSEGLKDRIDFMDEEFFLK